MSNWKSWKIEVLVNFLVSFVIVALVVNVTPFYGGYPLFPIFLEYETTPLAIPFRALYLLYIAINGIGADIFYFSWDGYIQVIGEIIGGTLAVSVCLIIMSRFLSRVSTYYQWFKFFPTFLFFVLSLVSTVYIYNIAPRDDSVGQATVDMCFENKDYGYTSCFETFMKIKFFQKSTQIGNQFNEEALLFCSKLPPKSILENNKPISYEEYCLGEVISNQYGIYRDGKIDENPICDRYLQLTKSKDSYDRCARNIWSSREGILKVTFPNGGETLKLGKIYTITWDSKVAYPVNIGYFCEDGNGANIAQKVSNNGSFNWTVSVNNPSYKHCKISIQGDEYRFGDESDDYFTVE